MQQGGSPSPFDRNMGTKMAIKAGVWLSEQVQAACNPEGEVYTNDPNSAILLGVVKKAYNYGPVTELKKEADFK